MTSVGLTPQQKEQIADVFDSIPMQSADIFGRDDLNNLLGRHDSIERQHFKLWFTSVPVFEELLHARAHNFTRDTLQRVVTKARLYVHNSSFPKALDLLKRHNVCIICGIPGIGKTTLAEMLLLHFATQGYEIVRVSGDISEAHDFQYQGVRRMFYYDDFLGQAVLGDKLNKNEDQRLIEFVQAIQKSETSKFILTTREYILNQARIEYERIAEWVSEFITCVLDLKKYTRRVRAQILFNHVFFSDLPQAFKHALVTHARFVTLVDHTNYSPRIVQFMTDAARLAGIAPWDYFQHFKDSLDDPQRLWEHAFRAISDEARDLILVLFTLHSGCLLSDVRTAFGVFHSDRTKLLNQPLPDNDFESALKETEGNFTTTAHSPRGRTIAFHNPSIGDYVQGYLASQKDLVVQLIQSSVFLNQVERLWEYRIEKEAPPLFRSAILSNPEALVNTLRNMVTRTSPISLARVVASVLKRYAHPDVEGLFDDLIAAIEQLLQRDQNCRYDVVPLAKTMKRFDLFNSARREAFSSSIYGHLTRDLDEWQDFEPLVEFMKFFPELIDQDKQREIAFAFGKAAASVSDNLYDHDDPGLLREDAEKLEDLADYLKVNVSSYLREMGERAEKLEQEAGPEPDWHGGSSSRHSEYGWCSDAEINSMFEVFLNEQRQPEDK